MDSTQPVRQAPGGALLSHEKPPRGQSPVDVPHRLEASAGQRWQEAASQSPVQSGYAAVLSRSSGPWTLHHKVSSGQRGFAGEGAAQGRFPVPAEHRKDCGASPGSVLLGGGGAGGGGPAQRPLGGTVRPQEYLPDSTAVYPARHRGAKRGKDRDGADPIATGISSVPPGAAGSGGCPGLPRNAPESVRGFRPGTDRMPRGRSRSMMTVSMYDPMARSGWAFRGRRQPIIGHPWRLSRGCRSSLMPTGINVHRMARLSGGLGHDERPHRRREAFRLVICKPVTGVPNLLDPHAWVKTLQLSCHFHRQDRRISEDDESGNFNCTHQLAKSRAWRRQDVKRIHPGLQSRLNQELENLSCPKRMADT